MRAAAGWRTLLWFAGIGGVAGCGLTQLSPQLPPPATAQIENATFAGILEQPITLTNGSYEGAPFVASATTQPAVRLWSDLIAFGELDGIPGDEAAALLSATSGEVDSERVYISIVGTRNGQTTELGTTLVGDGVKVRTLSVADGAAAVDVIEAARGDATCCPTQLTRKTYVYDGAVVRLLTSTSEGPLSLAALGGGWKLMWMDDRPPPEGVNPPTFQLDGLRVSGHGGCNHYSASLEAVGPGKVKISPLAGTRMMCAPAAMQLEQEFMLRLERIDAYTFLAGRLALSGQRGDSEFLLLFDKSVRVDD